MLVSVSGLFTRLLLHFTHVQHVVQVVARSDQELFAACTTEQQRIFNLYGPMYLEKAASAMAGELLANSSHVCT